MRKEDHLQKACVDWFRLQHRNLMITSFPAGYVFGGDKTQRAITGKRMKDMGYLVGIPDLLIPHANRFYFGLFVELKTETGKLSKEQKEVIGKLEHEGYKCSVCRSVEEFIETVNEYLKFKDYD